MQAGQLTFGFNENSIRDLPGAEIYRERFLNFLILSLPSTFSWHFLLLWYAGYTLDRKILRANGDVELRHYIFHPTKHEVTLWASKPPNPVALSPSFSSLTSSPWWVFCSSNYYCSKNWQCKWARSMSTTTDLKLWKVGAYRVYMLYSLFESKDLHFLTRDCPSLRTLIQLIFVFHWSSSRIFSHTRPRWSVPRCQRSPSCTMEDAGIGDRREILRDRIHRCHRQSYHWHWQPHMPDPGLPLYRLRSGASQWWGWQERWWRGPRGR